MKFETALTLNDLNTKLNDLLTKCQQKKNETNTNRNPNQSIKSIE